MSAPTKQVGFSTVTPSGIEVYYQAEPKRLYRIRRTEPETGEWIEVPSVTTVLDVLHKPALTWWGQTVGVSGVLSLIERGLFRQAVSQADEPVFAVAVNGLWQEANEQTIKDALVQQKLTVNHVRDKAGARGNSVHGALEDWVEKGTIPDPQFYPEAEQGYITGLAKFLADVKRGARAKTPQSEVTVGSLKHRFAGRYDLRMAISKSMLVVSSAKGKTDEFAAGEYLWDLKTSKGFYDTHFLQLEAYEAASIECGYKPTKGRVVVRVDASGTYEVQLSKYTFDQYLGVRAAYAATKEQTPRTRGAEVNASADVSGAVAS